MTLSTTRNYAIVLLALSGASVASRAVPVSSTSFLTSSGNTSLGLADRDVVRDPYGSFAPASGGFFAPHASSIVGPNVGTGGGFPPSVLFGGGGGGSAGFAGGSGGGGSVPSFAALPASVPTYGNAGSPFQGGSSGNSSGSNGPSTTITFSAQVDESTVSRVPDSGASVILMGAGLLALGALRRRLSELRF